MGDLNAVDHPTRHIVKRLGALTDADELKYGHVFPAGHVIWRACGWSYRAVDLLNEQA